MSIKLISLIELLERFPDTVAALTHLAGVQTAEKKTGKRGWVKSSLRLKVSKALARSRIVSL